MSGLKTKKMQLFVFLNRDCAETKLNIVLQPLKYLTVLEALFFKTSNCQVLAAHPKVWTDVVQRRRHMGALSLYKMWRLTDSGTPSISSHTCRVFCLRRCFLIPMLCLFIISHPSSSLTPGSLLGFFLSLQKNPSLLLPTPLPYLSHRALYQHLFSVCRFQVQSCCSSSDSLW